MHDLILQLITATLMMTWTVLVHFIGIILILRLLSQHGRKVAHLHAILRQILLLISAVLGLVFLHTIEIWSYALLYFELGAITPFEPALYFSTVSFTSLGYGDILLPAQWRLVGAIEAANGLILFGWTTAFLMSLMGKLRALEHDWLEG
ncbi:MAG: potassium channel family protein [Hyphomicrobiales bacterium]